MHTPDSPAVTARSLARQKNRMLPGTLLSFTTVTHPPKGFPDRPRLIGLIELMDGQRVLGTLAGVMEPKIGQMVIPRMHLSRVNAEGLRLYEIAYELTERVREPESETKKFPGYILALTGPSGVGKTTVSLLLTKMLSDFTTKVPIVTSRSPKEGDDQEYDYVTPKEFERMEKGGALVAWTHLPSDSEQRSYGYRKADILAIWEQGKLPVVVTEMHLLQGLAGHYGRRSILSFGLLPPGESKRAMLSHLLHRMRARGRETDAQIEERLLNAQADLDYFTRAAHLFDFVLVNEDLDAVLQVIKGHVLELAKA
ncbi:MAG: OB-fold domain-containing protein [Candidatus Peribacteraceae bacterium]|nr:OB-fold domain-containing protein [Candidatus Peribacteraceae bacterium]MDD5739176.1 OB-fold domain-containing protein [Candidatus Peribacteraceae bacterium]